MSICLTLFIILTRYQNFQSLNRYLIMLSCVLIFVISFFRLLSFWDVHLPVFQSLTDVPFFFILSLVFLLMLFNHILITFMVLYLFEYLFSFTKFYQGIYSLLNIFIQWVIFPFSQRLYQLLIFLSIQWFLSNHDILSIQLKSFSSYGILQHLIHLMMSCAVVLKYYVLSQVDFSATILSLRGAVSKYKKLYSFCPILYVMLPIFIHLKMRIMS